MLAARRKAECDQWSGQLVLFYCGQEIAPFWFLTVVEAETA